jgi:beta-galactosidase/beta-glucuronidase
MAPHRRRCRLGILVAQDMVQVYGYPWIQGHINQNHSTAKPRYYWNDLKALLDGRGNHPCIFQWTLFNEADMIKSPPSTPFDPAAAVAWARQHDPTRCGLHQLPLRPPHRPR